MRMRDAGARRKRGSRLTSTTCASKLKKLLPDRRRVASCQLAAGGLRGTPRRSPQNGYHELHLADAFERYLGKGLPSIKIQAGGDNPNSTAQNRAYRGTTPNTGGLHRVLSDTSDTIAANATNANTYPVSNAQVDPTQKSLLSINMLAQMCRMCRIKAIKDPLQREVCR